MTVRARVRPHDAGVLMRNTPGCCRAAARAAICLCLNNEGAVSLDAIPDTVHSAKDF